MRGKSQVARQGAERKARRASGNLPEPVRIPTRTCQNLSEPTRTYQNLLEPVGAAPRHIILLGKPRLALWASSGVRLWLRCLSVGHRLCIWRHVGSELRGESALQLPDVSGASLASLEQGGAHGINFVNSQLCVILDLYKL